MRRPLMSLTLCGLLFGGCSSTNPSVKSTVGETAQDENARLKATLDACEKDRADAPRLEAERASLKERLEAAEQDRDATKAKLAESERQRLDAERRLDERRRKP